MPSSCAVEQHCETFAVLGVGEILQFDLVAAVTFTGIIAYKLDHPFPGGPGSPAERVSVAEPILRSDFVFQRTPLEAVCDGRQGAALQTFLFQGQPLSIPSSLVHSGDGRHPVAFQPIVHDIQIGIGVGMFGPSVGKQNQVYWDVVLMQPNQEGGAVGAAPVGNHVDGWFTSH